MSFPSDEDKELVTKYVNVIEQTLKVWNDNGMKGKFLDFPHAPKNGLTAYVLRALRDAGYHAEILTNDDASRIRVASMST